ncbi:uncharacterized protein N7459_003119 [Penicillium hispanicum]|uniref:uncharacterized protein n=1 Tax=Penicillium hispanicum TaxID=1080232 RepID=UPI00254107FE|nr:uncharacterized protein N7459_003119 [Penicillium hispanicum]KAJ5587354.1 hypothetical protein N7459_003119 [Penicillium hispanicum]
MLSETDNAGPDENLSRAMHADIDANEDATLPSSVDGGEQASTRTSEAASAQPYKGEAVRMRPVWPALFKKGLSGPDSHGHEPQSRQLSSPQHGGNHIDSAHVERAISYHMGQFTVNGQNHSHPSAKASISTFPCPLETHSRKAPYDGSGAVSIPPNSNPYIHSSDSTSTSARFPSADYSLGDGDGLQQFADMPKLFSIELTADLDPGIRELQSDMPQPTGDVEMEMRTSPDTSLEFDSSFFDQSISSTINWLPNAFFTSTPGDQVLSPRVPASSSQHALSENFVAGMTWQPPVTNPGQISLSAPENISHTPSTHMSLGTNMESPRRYSRVGNEASPHSESLDVAKRSTDYYVDASGARLSKSREKHTPWSISRAGVAETTGKSPNENDTHRFGFPEFHGLHMGNSPDEVAYSIPSIAASTYNKIHGNFLLLCRNENLFFEIFDSDNFPTADDCSRHLAFYFDTFHAIYPILHLPTFNPNRCHWILTLALVAIGCHNSNIRDPDQCTAAFHELIRRALSVEKEKYHHCQGSLDLIQAMLLNCIGLFHSGSERAKTSALGMFKDLVTIMGHEKLLHSSNRSSASSRVSDEEMWSKWIQDEIRRRTGYCIWLLDCTIAYSLDERPLLRLDDGQAALPAHELLWQTSSAQAWKQQWEKSSGTCTLPMSKSSHRLIIAANESLYDAVHILYLEKRLVPGIGEFSHVLLIHALFHRMWEVGDYLRRPLSFWNPTAKKQSRETAIPNCSVWLPGIPSYSKWRNSACDCLDILHWAANSNIAKAAGRDQPSALHLHAARLVLLAPFREIRSLAIALATNQLLWNKQNQAIEWQYIWRWIQHDQYKARLSIIHAGVTLSHVRQYSTNAFHEPGATFLAVLTLWAYGSCHAHIPQATSPPLHVSRVDPLQKPGFIHLDRPCDDKLVQIFVREGHSMRGNVTGVGDICAPEGPERILRVGCETLTTLTAWGISKGFIATLSRLADLASQNLGAEQNQNVNADAC